MKPNGKLTTEGIRAKNCISNGALLSGASLLLTSGLIPTGWIIDGLAFLAPRNGCGDIVNFVKLKQATGALDFLHALGIG